jgi:hypothetical protein
MPELGRVTVEEVKAAYAATGLRPEAWVWCEPEWGGADPGRACGLGAVVCHRFSMEVACVIEGTDEDDEEDGDSTYDELNHVAELLDLDREYVAGFVTGFDGDAPDSCRGGACRRGWLDGRAAAAAVLPEGATPP